MTTVATDEEPAFTVTFECGNCGGVWTDSYPVQTEVSPSNARNFIMFSSQQCDTFGWNCDCCGTIECPVCELKEHVRIDGREPVEGDE